MLQDKRHTKRNRAKLLLDGLKIIAIFAVAALATVVLASAMVTPSYVVDALTLYAP